MNRKDLRAAHQEAKIKVVQEECDYPEEPIPSDGTILHALERLLPFSAVKAGYSYATTYIKGSLR